MSEKNRRNLLRFSLSSLLFFCAVEFCRSLANVAVRREQIVPANFSSRVFNSKCRPSIPQQTHIPTLIHQVTQLQIYIEVNIFHIIVILSFCMEQKSINNIIIILISSVQFALCIDIQLYNVNELLNCLFTENIKHR